MKGDEGITGSGVQSGAGISWVIRVSVSNVSSAAVYAKSFHRRAVVDEIHGPCLGLGGPSSWCLFAKHLQGGEEWWRPAFAKQHQLMSYSTYWGGDEGGPGQGILACNPFHREPHKELPSVVVDRAVCGPTSWRLFACQLQCGEESP